MKQSRGARLHRFLGLVLSLSVACRAVSLPFAVTPANGSSSHTATILPNTLTSTLVPTPSPSATVTRTATPGAAVLAEHLTAVSARHTEAVASAVPHGREATLIAQFPYGRGADDCSVLDLSPDRKWIAATCGPRENPTLLVQNRERKRWVLEFQDFLSPDTPEGTPGGLYPKFWSSDGRYLYFVSVLDYSGSGDFCFPGPGEYGLFRLNLITGSRLRLIAPANSFPGHEIDFAPAGRWYATDIDGLRITDLNTGEVNQIPVDGTITDLLWSPDGLHLAYSVTRCDEQRVESSWVYVWEPFTKQPELVLFSHKGISFRPESWSDNSTLKIEGEQWVAPDVRYTVYVYDTLLKRLTCDGTFTPSP